MEPDGLVAIVHAPAETTYVRTKDYYPVVQSHVNAEKTVSFFHVHWDTSSTLVGKLAYPSVVDNGCDGGIVYQDNFCLCNTTVEETAAYSAKPTRAQVLTLKVGAFDPLAMFDADVYTLVGTELSGQDDVTVYKKSSDTADYSTDTIFRVFKDDSSGDYIFLKNIVSIVKVCNQDLFSFRNGPTFYNIANPELYNAYHETEAYIDHVYNHPNTPPFVCKNLLKQFGYSNPSPKEQVLLCSNAFKSGIHTYTKDGGDLTFGVAGERGNLAAVVASIVLSDVALSPTADLDVSGGGVKSPQLRLTQVLRSFELTRSLHHRRTDGFINTALMGEGIYEIPDRESTMLYSLFISIFAHDASTCIFSCNIGRIRVLQSVLYACRGSPR